MGEKPAAGKRRGLQCHTLNSSDISDTKEEICFMSLSTLLSLPVFSSVVMARVAILRLESVMRFSRSRLQAVTADGCFMATCKGNNFKSYVRAAPPCRIQSFQWSKYQSPCFFKHWSVPQGLQLNLYHVLLARCNQCILISVCIFVSVFEMNSSNLKLQLMGLSVT